LRISNWFLPDAARVPRSASKARARYSTEVSAALAVLRKKWPAFASCRSVGRFGRVRSVRLAVLRPFILLSVHRDWFRFDLDLDVRLEYLTLAVANAKSHPISATGRHETAIAFLTDLEEKLDVAQVQLEIYNTLLPHVDDAVEVGDRIKKLSIRLLTMTEVCIKRSELILTSRCHSFTKDMRFHLTFP
jgi:hypothetical protein